MFYNNRGRGDELFGAIVAPGCAPQLMDAIGSNAACSVAGVPLHRGVDEEASARRRRRGLGGVSEEALVEARGGGVGEEADASERWRR